MGASGGALTAEYMLALDEGTTGASAFIFDREGRVRGHSDREFAQIFPQPGWVEHDAEVIWRTQLAVARQALKNAGRAPSDIAGIGITNQRETTVLWRADTGKPVANAIVWQDRRTAAACDALRKAGHEALFRERTGLVLDAYFSGTKIAWLLDASPGLRADAEAGRVKFGTIDSWLTWNLTGGRVHVTDASNASRTLLMNLRTLDWDDELLDILRVPRAMLPDIVSSSGVVGEADPALLGAPIPIAGIAGDQQAALFGQACFKEGMAKNTYGTGSFTLVNTGPRVPESDRLLATVAWSLDGKPTYALEGSIFVTGAAVQWLRDGLGIIANASETEAIARSVPDAGGVVFVPALTGLGAPYWDPHARGAIVGITRGTTRAHLVRATLEAIAHEVTDVAEAVREDAGVALGTLRVDGGGSANDLLLEIQAGYLGAPVERPRVAETTALGAAYLAGLATGMWASMDEIARGWVLDARVSPDMDDVTRERAREAWSRAIDRAREWADE